MPTRDNAADWLDFMTSARRADDRFRRRQEGESVERRQDYGPWTCPHCGLGGTPTSVRWHPFAVSRDYVCAGGHKWAEEFMWEACGNPERNKAKAG